MIGGDLNSDVIPRGGHLGILGGAYARYQN